MLLVLALAAFGALGAWQVQRMQWKRDLIATVDARVHAAPVALPPDYRLSFAAPETFNYLRVRLSGAYLPSQTALVRASTDLGTGYWAMTPLRMGDGRTVWVNRGFVPAGTSRQEASVGTPQGKVEIVGLLRASEPGGSLLQANKPAEDRWYSRDVAALSQARDTERAVPVFVDAQRENAASRARGVSPVPGLTAVRFSDNHLQYALTWLALAGLSAFGIVLVWRRERTTMP